MDVISFVFILSAVFFVYIVSAFFVIKIADNMRLDLKRWVFYGVIFHVFALTFLLFKKLREKEVVHK